MDFNWLYAIVLFKHVLFDRSSTHSDSIGNSTSLELKISADCPATTNSTHGQWSESVKDGGIECELKCDGGYEPNKCNVLLNTGNGTWNKQVPHCVKEPWTHTIWGKLILSVVAGVGGVVAVSLCICLIGFTCCGVRGGSYAAYIQVPDTEAGSCFACCQSTGAKGCSAWLLVPFIVAFTVTCVLLFVLSNATC
ncbi:uncharacterized protein LOC127831665 isoform X1 [Dreissena polymorpha]|uniref:Sushi domain-containing protein n=1 Tax=Dreissena polymorpha TaxID=45954 RepID=A0A9D4JMC8_DREPO|nr:uncharacterized protein LOC127831665 isoform X1 [Dreissena polymorpha]KAH3817400.1 hypothetical protein DPMN_118934 [Dreissena polymorpha]